MFWVMVLLIITIGIVIFMSMSDTKDQITKEQAIQIATDDHGDSLGTWVNATFENDGWHVSASSKSAKPPLRYIVDVLGKIIYKNLNTSQK